MRSVHKFRSNQTAVNQGHRRSCGFTFVELMVTLVVASILISVALPSVSEMIAKQRIKTAATDLYISLSKARSEALKRNSSVKIAPVSGQWQSGWTMVDTAATSVTIEDNGPLKNITIIGPADLTYRSSGRILGTTAPSFDISGTGTTTHWCVSVDLSGRPYQKKSSC